MREGGREGGGEGGRKGGMDEGGTGDEMEEYAAADAARNLAAKGREERGMKWRNTRPRTRPGTLPLKGGRNGG